MALLFDDGPSRDELREKFAEYAAAGRGLMLILEESSSSELVIRSETYSAAVDSAEEIVPLMIRRSGPMQVSLRGVLDLTGAFEEQMKRQRQTLETNLDAGTKQDLSRFYAGQKLYKEQEEWRELPFYRRIFRPYPQADIA